MIFPPYKYILVYCLLVPAGVAAQRLSEFINMALQENYQIKLVQNQQSIAENNNTLGNAGYLPELSVNGQYSKNIQNIRQVFFDSPPRVGSNALSDNYSAQALVNWTAFHGFRVFLSLKGYNFKKKYSNVNLLSNHYPIPPFTQPFTVLPTTSMMD